MTTNEQTAPMVSWQYEAINYHGITITLTVEGAERPWLHSVPIDFAIRAARPLVEALSTASYSHALLLAGDEAVKRAQADADRQGLLRHVGEAGRRPASSDEQYSIHLREVVRTANSRRQ